MKTGVSHDANFVATGGTGDCHNDKCTGGDLLSKLRIKADTIAHDRLSFEPIQYNNTL